MRRFQITYDQQICGFIYLRVSKLAYVITCLTYEGLQVSESLSWIAIDLQASSPEQIARSTVLL